jgi:hypothetical protein
MFANLVNMLASPNAKIEWLVLLFKFLDREAFSCLIRRYHPTKPVLPCS